MYRLSSKVSYSSGEVDFLNDHLFILAEAMAAPVAIARPAFGPLK